MKLSDYKNEDALDVLADLFEPASVLMTDKAVVNMMRMQQPAPKVATYIIRNHKKEIIQILAALDREDPETYQIGLLTLPVRLIEILNDPDLIELFHMQAQNTATYSGSAMENTEVEETE